MKFSQLCFTSNDARPRMSKTTKGKEKMKKTMLAVVMLFSVRSYADYVDRAAYLLSVTGNLKTKISAKDCRGIERGDWLDCESGDCKALVFDNSTVCDTWDCKALTQMNATYCMSAECRALILRDPSLCESQNCKAITLEEPRRCADAECKVLITTNSLSCK